MNDAPHGTQLVLPGLGESEELTKVRAAAARIGAAWKAVAHLRESEERERLQPLYFTALKRVERLTLGPCWWH